MLNTLNINLKTDIKIDRPTALGIKLMSQDKNNNHFILRFTNGSKPVALDDTYTVEILTKFQKSGASRLTSATVRQDYATWQFDTEYITQDETVYNFVYVRKAGNLVVSADANAFYFEVGLSEIDKDAGRVAEVYDENYENKLSEYMSDFDERLSEEVSIQLGSKANRQQEEWITPTLLNGAEGTVKFRKNQFGKVEFKGTLIGAASTPQLILPADYRPDSSVLLPVGTADATTPYKMIQILSSGAIYLHRPYATGNSIHLDGVSFYPGGD